MPELIFKDGPLAILVQSTADAGMISPIGDTVWGRVPRSVASCRRWMPFRDDAELILSPAYDLGHTADELRKIHLEKLRDVEK